MKINKKRKESIIKKRKKSEIVQGTLSKHKRGFGFVIPESGEGEDIFISPDGINGAMNGDYVAVRLLSSSMAGAAREGKIEHIIKRAAEEVVGTFEKSKRFGFVVPYDKRLNDDIFVLKKDFNGAQSGDMVVVKITKYPDKNNSAEGKITEIISKRGESGGDIKALIRQFNLKTEFPSKVEAEAKIIPLKITQEEINKRIDLRNRLS